MLVKSELGLGSTFSVVIPINFSGETEIVYVPELKHEIDSKRFPVLVVEDNSETLFVYDKYLKGTRFQPIPAKNIKEARAALQEFKPLAIVLDVLLQQGEHSWDLLRELKHDPSTASIPVLVITVIDNRDKAKALGADGFHAKPLDRIWLLQHLEDAVRKLFKKTLLLIDDDEVSRYLVRNVLAQGNFRIIEAKSGQEGLQKASEEKPDAVILDLVMPEMSGFEVLQQLKANPETSAIPVIIHTSKALDSGERNLLSDAIAVVAKEIASRDLLLERFTDAFQKAGISISGKIITEEQHV